MSLGRFSLNYEPQIQPNQCRTCGGTGDKKLPFLDTGTTEEFYGAVYYCRECVYSMGELFNFVDARELGPLNNTIQSQIERIAELEKLNLELEHINEAIGRYNNFVSTNGTFVSADIVEIVEGSTSVTNEFEPKFEPSTTEPVEPINDENLVGVRTGKSGKSTTPPII